MHILALANHYYICCLSPILITTKVPRIFSCRPLNILAVGSWWIHLGLLHVTVIWRHVVVTILWPARRRLWMVEARLRGINFCNTWNDYLCYVFNVLLVDLLDNCRFNDPLVHRDFVRSFAHCFIHWPWHWERDGNCQPSTCSEILSASSIIGQWLHRKISILQSAS